MAGLIGAAANVGYLLVGVMGLVLANMLKEVGGWLTSAGLPDKLVAALTANQGWRLLMILGTLPALLTFFIRLFVPESEKWQQERSSGSTSHWATRDLLGVLIGACGPALMVYVWADHQHYAAAGKPSPYSVAMLLAISACGVLLATAGYTYPVIRYLQRHGSQAERGAAVDRRWQPIVGRMLLAACLSGIALLGTWGSAQWAPSWADQLTGGSEPAAKAWTQMWSAFGAIVGTIAAALAGDWLGRRVTYCLLCIASLASAVVFFQFNDRYGATFLGCAFLIGLFTASFYGWLPLYLPELFRTRVRATGQGFSFNFGRILAAVGTLQTGALMGVFPKLDAPRKMIDVNLEALQSGQYSQMLRGGYPQACTVMSLIYVAGMLLIWLAPETKGKPLPD